ncbi:MAG: signal peptidase I [Bulleidia sp.]
MLQTKKHPRSFFWQEVFDFLKILTVTLIIFFGISRFLIRPIRIEGNSMFPTLKDSSLGVSNVAGRNADGLDRFEIVIIYLADRNEYLVKRVIGLPGETIAYTNGQLTVDGKRYEERFLDDAYVSTYGGSFMTDVRPITLGPDEYYCLGDNRPNSRDSRFYGPFTGAQIVAKGAFILLPFSEAGLKSW